MKNGLIINSNGDKIWYKNSLYHREDGPAVEHASGDKEWYIENKLHTQEEFEKLIKLRIFGKYEKWISS